MSTSPWGSHVIITTSFSFLTPVANTCSKGEQMVPIPYVPCWRPSCVLTWFLDPAKTSWDAAASQVFNCYFVFFLCFLLVLIFCSNVAMSIFTYLICRFMLQFFLYLLLRLTCPYTYVGESTMINMHVALLLPFLFFVSLLCFLCLNVQLKMIYHHGFTDFVL